MLLRGRLVGWTSLNPAPPVYGLTDGVVLKSVSSLLSRKPKLWNEPSGFLYPAKTPMPCDDSIVLVYVTKLPHLSTTAKCVVVSPGPVTGSATARRVPDIAPATS